MKRPRSGYSQPRRPRIGRSVRAENQKNCAPVPGEYGSGVAREWQIGRTTVGNYHRMGRECLLQPLADEKPAIGKSISCLSDVRFFKQSYQTAILSSMRFMRED